MEQKYVRVPFEVEMAKRIQNKECEGIIVTRDGRNARVLCFDVKDAFRHIIALVDCGNIERDYTYDNNGRYYERIENEKDLMLEIPEYMTFKDGDVIAFDNYDVISIIKDDFEYSDNRAVAHYYVDFNKEVGLNFYDENKRKLLNIARKATESEKQELIDALKASIEPKAKEYLKRFFGIEEKKEYVLNFRDLVLVRSSNEDKWCAAEFSHKDGKWYAVFGGLYYEQCIPYNEQTAHLLGTTDNLD